MKLSVLIATAVLAVSLSSLAQAEYYSTGGCGGGSHDKPECANKTTLIDTTYFNKKWTSDTAGSTTSNGDLSKFGGENAHILSKTGDFVNWTHQFAFNPQVKKDGIIDAWITISLRDFETDLAKKDDDDHDEHHDHEKDNDGHDRNKKDSKEYKVNFKGKFDDSQCGTESDTTNESAKLLLEGSNWITINDVDTGAKKFDVVLQGLYDGEFDVQLISTLNDFEIEWSKLEIDYCPEIQPQSPVPEPSTMVLLSAGLLGLGMVRRRMKK
jgi:hypothetical protein